MKDKRVNISDEDLAVFLDGNADAALTADVLAAIGLDGSVAETISLAEAIDREASMLEMPMLPMRELAAADSHNLCSLRCETMLLRRAGHDADRWSLLETAKANNWMSDAGTPLHHVGRLLEMRGMAVQRIYDGTVGAIADALEGGAGVIAVIGTGPDHGRLHAVCLTKVDSKRIHYADPDTSAEVEMPVAEFDRAWQASGRYMVVAGDDTAAYNPCPINVAEVELDTELEELTEAIAENAHDIWARARMDEGWVYGPERDDNLKRHPDLVPYSRLPESEKEYDRIMAMNTLRLVRRLGFDIINRQHK